MKSRILLVISILCVICPLKAIANYGLETLPEGVRSPSLRYGNISQLNQKYTSSGRLAHTVDLRSIQFDGQRLAMIDSRMKEVVSLFNRMGQYELGSKINKGTLQIDAHPEIQYTALVFAYGVSERWTLGFGAPVVKYKNDIQVSKTGSNLEFYKQQAAALGQTDLINGLNELDRIDLVQAFHEELAKKGYNSLEDQKQTFMGDLQISSLYRFEDINNVSNMFRLNLNLPTGPAYDADNLAALNQFGYTYVEPQWFTASPRMAGFQLTGMLGFRYYLPDQITARVPLDENDILPDQSQKEVVQRNSAPRWSQGVQLSFDVNDSWTLYGISEWAQKGQDKYYGSSHHRNYDLLGQETDTETHVVTAGITYSSVHSYMKSKKGIPAMITVQASDMISGKNVERQLVQELNAVLFF